MNEALDPQILDQLQTILRRDLKLAAGQPLPPDMPFFGGDVDLDSLDMLLVLTSVERHFGVKIADHEVGKQVFQSVGTLAHYIQEHRGGVASEAALIKEDKTDWLARLPHGPAFRFITRVVDVQPGKSASGIWKLTGEEPFFAAHFPGRPIVPGVLIAEALAQISGFAGPINSARQGMLVHLDVKFEAPASPPLEIELSARFISSAGSLQNFEVIAQAGNVIFARGTLTLHRPQEGAR